MLNVQYIKNIQSLKAGHSGEPGAWRPTLRLGAKVIWTGTPCRNRDESTSRSWSAREIAFLVQSVLTKGEGWHKEHVRLCWDSMGRSFNRPGAFESMKAREALVEYAIGEAAKVRSSLVEA
jgi:hypothetical protein